MGNLAKETTDAPSSSNSDSSLHLNIDLILPSFSLTVLKSEGNQRDDQLVVVEGTELKFFLDSNPKVPSSQLKPISELRVSLGRLVVDDVSMSGSHYHNKELILPEYRRLCSIFPAPKIDDQLEPGFKFTRSQFGGGSNESALSRVANCRLVGCNHIAVFACPRCEDLNWPPFVTCSQAHYDILWQQYHAGEHELQDPPKYSSYKKLNSLTSSGDKPLNFTDSQLTIGTIEVNVLPIYSLYYNEFQSFLFSTPSFVAKYSAPQLVPTTSIQASRSTNRDQVGFSILKKYSFFPPHRKNP
jgi:hypothetical protein